MMHYLINNVEDLWTPKKIYSSNDWLVTQKETGQTPKRYAQGGPLINWMDKRCSTITLFLIDDTIDEETSEKMRKYTEAYFYGCKIKLVRQGDKVIEDYFGRQKLHKTVPKNFIEAYNVTTRENPITDYYGTQLNCGDIQKGL